MLRIFVGYDHRQPVAYHVLCQSIIEHATVPVSITPLILDTLPIKRKGLTDFTFSRFLVPYLCDYKGIGVFLDSDMMLLDDISKLADIKESVGFVNFEGDFSFERPSMMVFNCEKCLTLTPDYIENTSNELFDFLWAEDVNLINEKWNHLAGYMQQTGNESLIHYTQGIPGYKECRDAQYSDKWFNYLSKVNESVSWLEILGRSMHAKHVLSKI